MERNQRGFIQGEQFPTTYHGGVRVQQSSSVAPSIWVFSEKAYSNNPETDPSPVLHLRLNEAKELRDRLSAIIEEMESYL